jgi:hypothetical protein
MDGMCLTKYASFCVLYTHGKERKMSVETGPYTANRRVATGADMEDFRPYVTPNNPVDRRMSQNAMYSLRKGTSWHSAGVSDPWRFK